MTRIKMWFLEQMKELVDLEEKILACRGSSLPDELLIQAKRTLLRQISGRASGRG